MSIKEKIEYFENLYKSVNVCEETITDFSKCEKEEDLLDIYMSHPTYSLEKSIPESKIIEDFFTKEQLNSKNIYFKEKLELLSDFNEAVFFNCSGLVAIKNMNVSTLYFGYDCDTQIVCGAFSVVHIRIYDNSKVNIVTHPTAKVFVRRYGEEAKYTAIGQNIIEKQ